MKTFRLIGMAVAAVLTCMNLTACSEEEDDEKSGSGTPSTSIGVVNPESGLRIRQVGELAYYYNSDGKLDYVYNEDREHGYVFDHSTNQMKGFNDDRSDLTGEVYTLSYNKDGFVNEFSGGFSYSDKEDGYYEDHSEHYNLTYDGEGHLVKITGSAEESEKEEGYTYSSTASYTINLTWENGLLTKLNQKTKIKVSEDGENYEIELKLAETYDYDDNRYPNPFKQYGATLSWGGIMDIAVNVGMLGFGPEYLPVKRTGSTTETYKYTYEGEVYEDEESYDTSFDYTYWFNADGSINECRIIDNYEDYYEYIPYSYGTATENVSAKKYQSTKTRSTNARRSFGFILKR